MSDDTRCPVEVLETLVLPAARTGRVIAAVIVIHDGEEEQTIFLNDPLIVLDAIEAEVDDVKESLDGQRDASETIN